MLSAACLVTDFKKNLSKNNARLNRSSIRKFEVFVRLSWESLCQIGTKTTAKGWNGRTCPRRF